MKNLHAKKSMPVFWARVFWARAFLTQVFLTLGLGVTVLAQESLYYSILPVEAPKDLFLEVGGIDTLPDGRLALVVRRGDVWILSNPDRLDDESPRWSHFASGLHEPLGLLSHDGAIFVTQRSEVTRIADRDGDGIADEYRSFAKGWGVSGNYHEYAYGPVVDSHGDFWITLNATIGKLGAGGNAWRGWGMRVNGEGKLEPVCAGLRSPCGLGTNLAGDVFATDQQGNWVPTCSLIHMEVGNFFGHADSLQFASLPGSPIAGSLKPPSVKTVVDAAKAMPAFKLPAVWFPYRKVGRSTTDLLADSTEGKFGPFRGQLFVGEFTQSAISRVFLEKVNGTYQGACFPFLSGFRCGVFRMAWSGRGDLFAGETNRGWNSVGTRSYGLERVHWSGKIPFEILEMRARFFGFELRLTRPTNAVVTASSVIVVPECELESYTYKYHATYGSPEVDRRVHKIRKVVIGTNGKRIELHVDDLRRGYVHELRWPGLRSMKGEPLLHPAAYYTLNEIPEKGSDQVPAGR